MAQTYIGHFLVDKINYQLCTEVDVIGLSFAVKMVVLLKLKRILKLVELLGKTLANVRFKFIIKFNSISCNVYLRDQTDECFVPIYLLKYTLLPLSIFCQQPYTFPLILLFLNEVLLEIDIIDVPYESFRRNLCSRSFLATSILYTFIKHSPTPTR